MLEYGFAYIPIVAWQLYDSIDIAQLRRGICCGKYTETPSIPTLHFAINQQDALMPGKLYYNIEV